MKFSLKDLGLFSLVILLVLAFGLALSYLFGMFYNGLRSIDSGHIISCKIISCYSELIPTKDGIRPIEYISLECPIDIPRMRSQWGLCSKMGQYINIFYSEKLHQSVYVKRKVNRIILLWKIFPGYSKIFLLGFLAVFIYLLGFGIYGVKDQFAKLGLSETMDESNSFVRLSKFLTDFVLLLIIGCLIITLPILIVKVSFLNEGSNVYFNGLLMLMIIVSICIGPWAILAIYNKFRQDKNNSIKVLRNVVAIVAFIKVLVSSVKLFNTVAFDKLTNNDSIVDYLRIFLDTLFSID